MNPCDRPCSVATCDQPAEAAGLMCPYHWAHLPGALGAAVLDAWMAFQRHGAGEGRWAAYNSISRTATGYHATARPLAEVSGSAIHRVAQDEVAVDGDGS